MRSQHTSRLNLRARAKRAETSPRTTSFSAAEAATVNLWNRKAAEGRLSLQRVDLQLASLRSRYEDQHRSRSSPWSPGRSR